MTIFIDKRKDKESITASKQKFIRRTKRLIKEKIDNFIKGSSIKDITKKGQKIIIKKRSIHEPEFKYVDNILEKDLFVTGNNKHNKGDKIAIRTPTGDGNGEGEGGNSDVLSEDEFMFYLNKDEFNELLFDHLELPNLLKNKGVMTKYIRKRAGYNRKNIPARLDLMKTFKLAIARRLATKQSTPFLDEIDLRYKNYKMKEIPVTSAVMFCIMDVSGSMDSEMKILAKKFYILLNLFLESKYKNVELVFIRHHVTAEECSEFSFFNKRETGGTVISSALGLASNLIKERYSPDIWNIYIAQTGDGDNYPHDNENCVPLINNLLQDVRLFLYFQVIERETNYMNLLKEIDHKKLKAEASDDPTAIYKFFSDVFKKGQK